METGEYQLGGYQYNLGLKPTYEGWKPCIQNLPRPDTFAFEAYL